MRIRKTEYAMAGIKSWKNNVTDITSIDISFFKLVFSTDYTIKTRASETDNWREVAHITHEPSAEQNKVDSIKTVKELDKYVRFEFNKVNTQAGGNSVSVREIEVNGTQVPVPYEPESAKEVLDTVKRINYSRHDRSASSASTGRI